MKDSPISKTQLYFWLASVVFLAVTAVFFIARARYIYAATLSEGFFSTESLALGSLVSVNSEKPDSVELASLANKEYLLGVVGEQESSLVELNTQNSNLNVLLAGDVVAFVSDINGEINEGDFIGPSWIAGVGMKADTAEQQKLLGIALSAFEPSGSSEAQSLNTPDGQKNANIGQIPVRLFAKEAGDFEVFAQSALERLAEGIAGKSVSFGRLVAASGLFLLSVIIGGIFLANAIRGSFISLGRNPLASGSIFSSLLQVSGVTTGLILIGAFVAYVVLVV